MVKPSRFACSEAVTVLLHVERLNGKLTRQPTKDLSPPAKALAAGQSGAAEVKLYLSSSGSAVLDLLCIKGFAPLSAQDPGKRRHSAAQEFPFKIVPP